MKHVVMSFTVLSALSVGLALSSVSARDASAEVIFDPAVNFLVGTSPWSVVIDDLNGDGKPDLAVTNEHSDDISVLLGNGDGTFGTSTNFAAGNTPRFLAVHDLNGNGKPDLVATNSDDNSSTNDSVAVLLGNGDGTFGVAANYAVRVQPISVAIDDIDNDGKPDLAVVNETSQNVSVLLGNGDGTFGTAVHFSALTFPRSVAIGDLNDDGKLDLAVAGRFPSRVSVLLGNGDGTFGGATTFGVGTGDEPRSVAIGDLNDDGKLDLAVANTDGDNDFTDDVLAVLLGNGDGTFGAAANFTANQGPFAVAISDLNDNGKLDLVVANILSDDVSVLLGNGDGTFGAATNFVVGGGPKTVAISDLNGDVKPDLAIANSTSDDISVLIATSPDSDGDGINDEDDNCPMEDATGLDADQDGCIDNAQGLIDLINDLPPEAIDEQLKNSLISKITNAENQASKENICSAVNVLESFQNQVEAQRGNKITDETATLLISYADNLITLFLLELPTGETCN